MLFPDTREALNSFTPIGLNEMDQVSFMNRTDLKFVLSAGRVTDLLTSLDRGYKILEINNERLYSYCTTYLDTSDFMFFNQHLTGKLERNKVRFRKYESTGITFLEVKRTTNKNRTIKWRIENKLSSDSLCDNKATEFISMYVPQVSLFLKPVLISRFKRATFVGSDMKERVTIDYDLCFADTKGNNIEMPSIAIVELKKDRINYSSLMAKRLKEMSVRSTSFSKYCVGASLLHNPPRTNLIKSKLLLIKKIENEYSSHISV